MPAPEKPAILLVDDEVPLLEAMLETLQAEFHVDGAATAEEASGLIATRRYDLIVSDQLLPGEPGLEFLVRSAELQPTARRILLTGYFNPELLSRSVTLAGLSACLLKPISGTELIKEIKKALAA